MISVDFRQVGCWSEHFVMQLITGEFDAVQHELTIGCTQFNRITDRTLMELLRCRPMR